MAWPAIAAVAAKGGRYLKAGGGVNLLRIAEIMLKPNDPKQGPPVPASFDISWPGFLKRAVDRLIEEPPWVTIPKRGLKEELKREFEVVTGRKIG